MGKFSDLFRTPFHKQEKEVRAWVYGIFGHLWLGVFMTVLAGVLWLSLQPAEAGTVFGFFVGLACVVTAKIPLGILGLALANFSSIALWKTEVRAPHATYLYTWKRRERVGDTQTLAWPEPVEVRKEKLANQGRVRAVVLIGCLLFWALILNGK